MYVGGERKKKEKRKEEKKKKRADLNNYVLWMGSDLF